MAASLPLPTGSASCCQETALPGTPGVVCQRRRGPGVAPVAMQRRPKAAARNGVEEIRNSKYETRNKFEVRSSKETRKRMRLIKRLHSQPSRQRRARLDSIEALRFGGVGIYPTNHAMAQPDCKTRRKDSTGL